MLLDLDQGSTTVWKNGEKLGVMQAEGLRGPFCWAVTLSGDTGARIESAAADSAPACGTAPTLGAAAVTLATKRAQVSWGQSRSRALGGDAGDVEQRVAGEAVAEQRAQHGHREAGRFWFKIAYR